MKGISERRVDRPIVTRNGKPYRGMGQGPMVAEPASLFRRHVGVLDAAAAVRLPQRLTVP